MHTRGSYLQATPAAGLTLCPVYYQAMLLEYAREVRTVDFAEAAPRQATHKDAFLPTPAARQHVNLPVSQECAHLEQHHTCNLHPPK